MIAALIQNNAAPRVAPKRSGPPPLPSAECSRVSWEAAGFFFFALNFAPSGLEREHGKVYLGPREVSYQPPRTVRAGL